MALFSGSTNAMLIVWAQLACSVDKHRSFPLFRNASFQTYKRGGPLLRRWGATNFDLKLRILQARSQMERKKTHNDEHSHNQWNEVRIQNTDIKRRRKNISRRWGRISLKSCLCTLLSVSIVQKDKGALTQACWNIMDVAPWSTIVPWQNSVSSHQNCLLEAKCSALHFQSSQVIERGKNILPSWSTFWDKTSYIIGCMYLTALGKSYYWSLMNLCLQSGRQRKLKEYFLINLVNSCLNITFYYIVELTNIN